MPARNFLKIIKKNITRHKNLHKKKKKTKNCIFSKLTLLLVPWWLHEYQLLVFVPRCISCVSACNSACTSCRLLDTPAATTTTGPTTSTPAILHPNKPTFFFFNCLRQIFWDSQHGARQALHFFKPSSISSFSKQRSYFFLKLLFNFWELNYQTPFSLWNKKINFSIFILKKRRENFCILI